ncbi:adenylate/guanylate cyclase domain-containing protein [Synechococcus sp. BA-124 BA4]|uniref:adenylate/guanylate cyclase domain-containing protein n=1 Tax=unclassified Synechococcus TaxID=2626047 RepID=UPI002AD40FF4|nr:MULTISPECIES: adenylate/guanylate cyclase domain-containing protein [unclassified Synechococcus]MEA5398638.1 adenylate/guanylate cyclase domain-containing protein [Synechococcus sp. BA-124 BA4]CAK6694762.1 hypothetical protein BBFGKLBO_01708 [Synechococcus sp. CBW1107]
MSQLASPVRSWWREVITGVDLKGRLSRRISFWIFLNFILVEALVLIPSVLRQAERLEQQMRALTNAKIEWIVAKGLNTTATELLAAIEELASPSMVHTIRGASLLKDSDGLVLGSFGEAPASGIRTDKTTGNASSWVLFTTRYDAVWSPQELGGGDLRLVIRHDASGLQAGLIRYVGKILLIVLGIALFLTFATMFILDRLVISRVLELRQRLILAGRAFLEGSSIDPTTILMPARGNDELSDVESAFNQSFLRTYREMGRRIQAETLAKTEQQRAEKLLLNILPEPIADEMKKGNDLIAQIHDEVSVLFADIVGFTELSRLLPCHDLVSRLNDVFSAFDDLSDRHGLEKIKTIGDNYMVASGLPRSIPHHAEAIADMALEMQAIIPRFSLDGASPLALRIGIHSGPVVAGVIGRRKFTYDLWGETVNIASRMESSGLPGRIQLTDATRHHLESSHVLTRRGLTAIKGVGDMSTHWLLQRR